MTNGGHPEGGGVEKVKPRVAEPPPKPERGLERKGNAPAPEGEAGTSKKGAAPRG